MQLTMSVTGHGHHPAAWRVSSLARGPGRVPHYEAVARLVEAGGLDALLFLPPSGTPDGLLAGDGDAMLLDTMPLIASLIARTSWLGLGATVYMAHTEPFHTARAFSVMDNLSAGRTAWVLDTQGAGQQEADFGHAAALDTATHYARAAEYIEVACKLWDSWEDGAVVADKASGVFADSSKIHPINHAGPYFQVRGPLVAVRPVQGHPVIVMRDGSEEGLRLAAGHAELFLADSGDIVARLRAIGAARPRNALRILLNIAPLLAPTEAAAQERSARLDAMSDPAALPDTVPRFIGTPSAFADHLVALKAATGCDGFNILPAVLPDDAEQVVAEVLPLLRQRGLRPAAAAAGTLREQLGLPRPVSIFASRAA